MHRSLFLAAALFVSTSFVAAITPTDACNAGSSLEAVPFPVKVNGKVETEYKCECVNARGKTKPFATGCKAKLKVNKKGAVHCVPKCASSGPVPSPSASVTAKEKSKRAALAGHQATLKRSQQITLLPAQVEEELCPPYQLACPIFADSITGAMEVDCVHPLEDVDNCGACGVSCNKISGVRSSSCVLGSCEIHSCAPGHVLRRDIEGNRFCRRD